MEGTLFVYSRIAPPTTGFTIMNQLSMENLTEALTADLEFQNQDPFLLYRNAKLMIYGLWFYDMYDCTRIGKLLINLCKGEKPSAPNKQLAMKNDLVVPSPNSTGGSSSTSSISETAIDEELIQVAPDEKIQTSATTNGPNQPVNIMDLLFKAKDRYDKDHSIETNKEEPTKRNDAAANENAQPHFVNFDSSRKVSVASLFSQSNAKPENRTRPSSADMFERRETENTRNSTNTSNQGNRRYAARSLSLSFSNEQFHNAHKNIVNGAISVEELESPVMGKPSRRSRYHSTSEGLVRNGPSPRMPLAEESALSKLFAPVSKTVAKPDNQLATLPQFVSNFSQNLSNSNKASALSQTVISSGGLPPKPPKTLHRSQSIPSTVTMLDSGDPPRKILTDEIEATKAPFASSLPAPLMATLHENPNVAGLVKSMSVASGLAGMNRMPPAMQPVQLAATLHGTAKKDREKMLLLSPHALQPVRNRPRNVQCNNTSDTCEHNLCS
ncbi:unnamed protein product [Clavelina lepadiformis]|uniref:5'-(N(7)-methylguanosine 5'-triphospho)-[mRNA] hydrolase n=1 Tax=Clavelina lepadiformis TaxID=159417 RepID=A0ABP0EUZ9_CLALP